MKAKTLDSKFGGVAEGTDGPVTKKVMSFPRLQGWVFGAFNEASQDIHNLIPAIAKARLHQE